MTESSLRDRVQANVADSLLDYLAHNDEWGALDLAEVATAAAFEAMAGARPCVTCGKGIGPAKVGKGYVQCYDCNRRPHTSPPRMPVMLASNCTAQELADAADDDD